MSAILAEYGVAIVMITVISMVLTGIVKTPLKSKLNKKFSKFSEYQGMIWVAISFALPAIIIATYLAINKSLTSTDFRNTYGLVTACMQILYPIYEKFGGRKLLIFLGGLILKKKIEEGKIPKVLTDSNIVERAIETLAKEIGKPNAKKYLINYYNQLKKL